ncbi:hypothetical protein ABW19_dt0210155 [Dactylella cylindrospora]|nr:hypothetical protein ABW19_dt0210155 [Dactylella cylindrospora]
MSKEGFLWFTLGIGVVLAYKLTIYQLESFKRQAEIIPEEARETVDKATENALKLDTLMTLGKGVNYNLSRAAIRIIAERAISEEIFPSLLRKIRSSNPAHRHEALKTLRFLVLGKHKTEHYFENDNDHVLTKESITKLQSQAVFNTLIRACINALPKTLPDGSTTARDKETESYALECVAALITQQRDNFKKALEAGLATYMKLIPTTPNYPHIVAAFSDTEYQPENFFLFEIHSFMVYADDPDVCEIYDQYLKRAGLSIERVRMYADSERYFSRLPRFRDPTRFDRHVETFHRTLRETYPAARSVEEALELASAEGLRMEGITIPRREVWE